MFRIKRVKTSVVDEATKATVTATHYAATVHPSGAVGGWDRDLAKAVPVSQAVADAVLARYQGQKHTGTVTAEPCAAGTVDLTRAVATEVSVRADQFAAMQVELRKVRDDYAELTKQAANVANALEAARAAEQKAVQRAADAEAAWAESRKRIGELTTRVAELEAKPAEPKQQDQDKGRKAK